VWACAGFAFITTLSLPVTISGEQNGKSPARRSRHGDGRFQACGVRRLVLARASAGCDESFGAEKAWRYWSLTDPALHHAMYQFADEAALDRATKGENISRLVADFNRDWPEVTRTRELLVLAEEFSK
jgi:hypothetical protein